MKVTSPVAFLGLKNRGINVMYPNKTFATADHNTPTINQHLPVADPLSANQLKALEDNAKEFGILHWGLGHKKNGVVHIVGPENGITLPGATIVCGDSHTSTHGAFGAIAFGIGTSEVEMVLASQCIMQPKPKENADQCEWSIRKRCYSKRCCTLYHISINNFRRNRLLC